MVSGCFLPSGFFWPGRVTSSVSPARRISSALASRSILVCSSICSMSARTWFASWPMTGRSSAESLPICFKMAVSSPFFPRYLTRTASSTFRSCAPLSSSSACFAIASSSAFICLSFLSQIIFICCFHRTKKALRPRALSGVRDEKPCRFPRYHPHSGFAKKAGSFIVQITVPSVSPYRLSFQGNRSQAKVHTPSPLRRLQPVAAAL